MHRNIPIGSNGIGVAIAICGDCDCEMSFALSRVDWNMNWQVIIGVNAFESFSNLNNLLCCPAFSPHNANVVTTLAPTLTVKCSSLHFWKAGPIVSGLTVGPASVNCLNSKRIWQIWKLIALMRYVQTGGSGRAAGGGINPVCRMILVCPHWMLIIGSLIKSRRKVC